MLQLLRFYRAESGTVGEALRIGARSLLSHKLRSLLTMLGMIFGVAAVIAMLSIGEGARREALENIRLLGASNILIEALEADQVPEEDLELKSPGLHLRDMQALEGLLVDCRITAVLRSEADLFSGRQRLKVPLLGVRPGYLDQFPGMELKGRWITDADQRGRSRICVLGSEVARQLFPYRDPVGELVKVSEEWYRVTGVLRPRRLSEKGREELGLRDLNMDVYIPYNAFEGRVPREGSEHGVDMLVLSLGEGADVTTAADLVNAVIERRHHGARDTRITVPYDLMRQQQATQRTFNLVMGTIASISLLVGGIGIMNIMLSSVLERTREIGIRRAVGATSAEVLLQFVLESVILSLGGGLIGVLLGVTLAWLISGIAGWQTTVSAWAVLLAFAVSVSTGLVFGIYPARRAAALNPIDALRYE